MAVQADGKVLLSGLFTTLQPNGAAAPTTRNRIARVNADGTLDATFDPNANGEVDSVAVQADGKVLLGGQFTTLQPNGTGSVTSRARFASLLNGEATQSLAVPNLTQVQWSRGGTAPEVADVTFDLSTDGGATWTALGAGTRRSGGWQLTGQTLPNVGSIRARGRTGGGLYSNSSGWMEQVATFTVTGFNEARLSALLKRFNIGDVVDLDLSFVTTTGLEKILVLGLPKGLVYNATTKHITGKITALLGEVPVEIRVMNGKVIARSTLFNMSVSPYQFLGNYAALLENPDNSPPTPNGQIKVLITSPGVYSATLSLGGLPTRSAKGTFLDVPGDTQRTLPIFFAAGKGGSPPATTVNVTLNAANLSDAVTGNRIDGNTHTLRGFRLSKPGRTPAVTRQITVALTSAGTADGVAVPAGTGYFTGKVDAKGIVKMSGLTGDAQAFTASFDLSQTNQAVVLLQPYKNKSSYLGGIVTIGDLDLPSRGNSGTPPLADGLSWFKAADATEKAYPLGFPVQRLVGDTSRWITPPSSTAMGESLGLTYDEINVSYLNPLSVANLPTQFRLTAAYALLRIAPNVAIYWKGSTSRTLGTFAGTLTLPNGAGGVNGVLLQDDTFGTSVGTGLVRVPLPTTVLPKGSFQTIGIELEN
jgi:hypothetical protein